jgi:GntR family transcriptional repressor for pyruvate dehydrogenase complex
MTDSEKPLFSAVGRDTRLSDVVAGRILESIVSRGLRPGDRLPAERELAEQFDVSRTVVREAIRNLGGRGIIDARPGRGLTVAAVRSETVRQSMSLFLRARPSWDYESVHEVRQMVEVDAAGLAADRATDAEIAELERVCAEMAAVIEDTERASVVDMQFHRLLARATHNDLVGIMLDAIADSLLEIRRETFGSRGRSREALASHLEILGRVSARDAIGARTAMARHLDDVEEAWQRLVAASPLDPGDGERPTDAPTP